MVIEYIYEDSIKKNDLKFFDPNCEVCGDKLFSEEGSSLELHHYPIPKRHGGKKVIPICLFCHNFIDRICLADWQKDWIENAPKDMWKNMNREGRLFFLKMISLITDMEYEKELKSLAVKNIFLIEKRKYTKKIKVC